VLRITCVLLCGRIYLLSHLDYVTSDVTDLGQSETIDRTEYPVPLAKLRVPQGLEGLTRFPPTFWARSTTGTMPETQEVTLFDMETCEAMRREEWEVLVVGPSHSIAHCGLYT